MAFQPTPADISVMITTPAANATDRPQFVTERRVTPTWTVTQLKGKLETMTGIPPGCQRLRLRTPGHPDQWLDDNDSSVGTYGLTKGSEIEVHDSRPQGARPNFTDLSSVEKYTLPESTYESLPNSVLAWKKNQKLGRFDPNASSPEELMQAQAKKDAEDVQQRNITTSKRAIILPSSPPHIRRGTIQFVGPVPTIPFPGVDADTQAQSTARPIWVGVELDEPTGKNDGSVGGERYFTCAPKTGVFVKPEKIEVGDFPPLGLDDDLDDELEEI